MHPTRSVTVDPHLPASLAPLRSLARNLWWTWNPVAAELWPRIDGARWERSGHNPVALLLETPPERWTALSHDRAFVDQVGRAAEELRHALDRRATGPRIAYLCAEFGIDVSLPIYSGGLGVLAGDHLKAASDLGLPLVGISLLYREAFHQHIDPAGRPVDLHRTIDPSLLPITPVLNNGHPAIVEIPLADRVLRAQVWRADVGGVPLLLLDTHLESNTPDDRALCDRLYGGDLSVRLGQEWVLGVGGLRAAAAAGLACERIHLNEGHVAFALLERLREVRERHGLDLDTAREFVASTSIFTTHTPVGAGHDRFPPELIAPTLQPWATLLGTSVDTLLGWGREDASPDSHEPFCMTVLALRLAGRSGGVSRPHGAVSRQMWRGLWPGTPLSEIPITHVSNGVHVASAVTGPVAEWMDAHHPRWRSAEGALDTWRQAAQQIDDATLWHLRNAARLRLTRTLESRTGIRLDPHALTLGFARRFASYKRALLLFSDPDRLESLLSHPDRPVQIVFAGKAHQRDQVGKDIVRQVVAWTRDPRLRGRVHFVQDYDLDVARLLVGGCDAWLNTPEPPLEASGTSGMKAAACGGLNISVADGWWEEMACDPHGRVHDLPLPGWTIPHPRVHDFVSTSNQTWNESSTTHDDRQRLEAAALYDLLEQQVIPMFWDRRDPAGHPTTWLDRIRLAWKEIVPRYHAVRMVREYNAFAYQPAEGLPTPAQFDTLRAQAAVRRRWDEAAHHVTGHVTRGIPVTATADETHPVEVEIHTAGLDPQSLRVETLLLSPATDTVVIPLRLLGDRGHDRVRFGGPVVLPHAGRFSWTVRVGPAHPVSGARLPRSTARWIG